MHDIPPNSSPKTGIVLLNMGGPDSLEAVKPFLFNLFSDPDIIRLPLSGLLQKPLAWWIVNRRGEEAKKNYAEMGGHSPILPYTEQQARLLGERLAEAGHPLPVYIAMRYWHPFTEAAVEQMRADGIERLVVLPLYPHFSYTTSGSSLNALRRVMTEQGLNIPTAVIPYFYEQPDYQAALTESIRECLAANTWDCEPTQVRILFSAHSLPLKHVERTGDPYPDQIYETARAVMTRDFPGHPWDICYQSKVGKMPWLGPDVEGILHFYAGKRQDNILMVPVSFVSEHVETLVEIDKLYLPLAKELGIQHIARASAMNERPRFIESLAQLVLAELRQETPLSTQPVPIAELLARQATRFS